MRPPGPGCVIISASKAVFRSKVIPGKEEEGIKYRDYFDWEEPAAKPPPTGSWPCGGGKRKAF